MSGHAHHSPAEIRAKLNHPIVDGDGHWVEYDPVFAEQMRKVGGDKAADGFLAAMAATRDALVLSVEERRRRRIAMPGFWTRQTGNTYDRATAMMPHLLYERLDEIGSDFAIVYPTAGLRLPRIVDDETRRAVIRAYNIVSAGYFKDLSDRMTPAAIIPMHTPEEAIAELEFVTKQLGSKVGMFGSAHAAQGAVGRRQRPGHQPPRGLVRGVRHRQPLRLRPGLGEMPRGRDRADLPFEPAATRRCATRRPTSPTTISAISPMPAMPPPRASSSAASPGASRSCALPSSKAASAGARSCSAI